MINRLIVNLINDESINDQCQRLTINRLAIFNR